MTQMHSICRVVPSKQPWLSGPMVELSTAVWVSPKSRTRALCFRLRASLA